MESGSVVVCLMVTLVTLLGAADGQGGCPTLTLKAGFNATQYLGIWYEQSRLPAPYQNDIKCSRAEYTVDPATPAVVKVNNTGTNITTGTYVDAVGTAITPDAKEPAKLLVSFPQSPFPAPYWVVDTDYINYSVVYTCAVSNATGNNVTREFGWILSRSVTIVDAAITKTIAGVFERNSINATKFLPTSQEGCVNYVVPTIAPTVPTIATTGAPSNAGRIAPYFYFISLFVVVLAVMMG